MQNNNQFQTAGKIIIIIPDVAQNLKGALVDRYKKHWNQKRNLPVPACTPSRIKQNQHQVGNKMHAITNFHHPPESKKIFRKAMRREKLVSSSSSTPSRIKQNQVGNNAVQVSSQHHRWSQNVGSVL